MRLAEPEVGYQWEGESVGTTGVDRKRKGGAVWEIRFCKEREEAGSKFRQWRKGKDKDSEVRLGNIGRVEKKRRGEKETSRLREGGKMEGGDNRVGCSRSRGSWP